uniref:Integrase_H2C2 domain-containing protein n=1 Tax=Strongyloides venezuelensis TaxID=75913 RepID=A0A0K0EZK9_STRVS
MNKRNDPQFIAWCLIMCQPFIKFKYVRGSYNLSDLALNNVKYEGNNDLEVIALLWKRCGKDSQGTSKNPENKMVHCVRESIEKVPDEKRKRDRVEELDCYGQEDIERKVLKNAAHTGIEETVRRLKKYVWFEGIMRKTRQIILRCLLCFSRKHEGAKMVQEKMLEWPKPRNVWDRLHMDFMGPWATSDASYRYILTVKCAKSRFSLAFP